MDIQTLKLELVKLIIDNDNPKFFEKLLGVLKDEQQDFWFELSEDERKEIHFGISQLDSGEKIPLEDFLKKYNS